MVIIRFSASVLTGVIMLLFIGVMPIGLALRNL